MMKQGVTLFIVLIVAGAGVVGFRPGNDGRAVEMSNPRDSLKLEKYVKWVRDSIEAYASTFPPGTSYRLTIESGTYYSSPDDLFTIFVINGERCMVPCSPHYISFLELNKTGKNSSNVNFFNVKDIVKMPDGKYLVLHEGVVKTAICSFSDILVATLVSFSINQPVYHLISYDDHRKTRRMLYDAGDSSLLVFQEQFIPNKDMHLTYDSSSKRLNYRYGTNLGWNGCEMDSAYIFEGYFEYINGQFIHKQETREYLGSEADYEGEE